jgi:hypothetical protein
MFEYIKDNYHVPAQIGRRVIVYGKPGIIIEDRGHHLGVNFDEDRPGVVKSAHPTCEVEYLDRIGIIRKMTRSQRNYQTYLKSECSESFGEWLKITQSKGNL